MTFDIAAAGKTYGVDLLETSFVIYTSVSVWHSYSFIRTYYIDPFIPCDTNLRAT